jgi:hypothetical protein
MGWMRGGIEGHMAESEQVRKIACSHIYNYIMNWFDYAYLCTTEGIA